MFFKFSDIWVVQSPCSNIMASLLKFSISAFVKSRPYFSIAFETEEKLTVHGIAKSLIKNSTC